MEGLLALYHILSAIILTIVAGVEKVGFKRRLSKALGRKVSDQELTSISTWMKAIPAEKK